MQHWGKSHDHLFSSLVGFWSRVLADLGWLELLLLGLQSWTGSHARGKEFSASLLRLALAASLYHLWLERNARVVSGGCLSSH